MKLKITVAGLCLLVPDPTEARVSVLLVRSDMAPHTPHIGFAGATVPRYAAKGRFSLSLGALDNGLTPVTWPDEIMSFHDLLPGTGVKKATIEKQPAAHLTTWVDVPVTGPIELGPISYFTVESSGKEVPATNYATWVIGGVDPAQMTWSYGAFGALGQIAPITPAPGADEVSLVIRHCPKQEPEVEQGRPAPHFHMYAGPLTDKKGVAVKEVPTLILSHAANDAKSGPCAVQGSSKHHGVKHAFKEDEEKGASAFSCMLARADAI